MDECDNCGTRLTWARRANYKLGPSGPRFCSKDECQRAYGRRVAEARRHNRAW